MNLSDVVSNSGLSLYPLVGLIIFFVVFLAIVVYVALRRKESWDRARHLPLEDDPTNAARENGR